MSGSCGLALPNNEECIVSHNFFHPVLNVVGDLQAVLVNQAAAASTSVIHAAVTFVCTSWVLWVAKFASPNPFPLGVWDIFAVFLE